MLVDAARGLDEEATQEIHIDAFRGRAVREEHLTDDEFLRFFEGNLRPDEAPAVEEHLTGCEECKEAVDLALMAHAPATAEEQALLDQLPCDSVEETLEKLKPAIRASMPKRAKDGS